MNWLNKYIPDKVIPQHTAEDVQLPQGRVHRAGRTSTPPPVYDTPKSHQNERRYTPQATIPTFSAGNEYVNVHSSADMASLANVLNSGEGQAMLAKASGRYPITKNLGLGGSVSSDFSSREDADASIFADLTLGDIANIEASRKFNRDTERGNTIHDSIKGTLGLGNLNVEAARNIDRGVMNGGDAVRDVVSAKYAIKPPMSIIADYYSNPNGRGKAIGLEYAKAKGLTFGGKVSKDNNVENDKPQYNLYLNKQF
jgi:hypothetical protein